MGHVLVVKAVRAGKKDQCPVCHHRLIIPVENPQLSGRNKKAWNADNAERATHEEGELVGAGASAGLLRDATTPVPKVGEFNPPTGPDNNAPSVPNSLVTNSATAGLSAAELAALPLDDIDFEIPSEAPSPADQEPAAGAPVTTPAPQPEQPAGTSAADTASATPPVQQPPVQPAATAPQAPPPAPAATSTFPMPADLGQRPAADYNVAPASSHPSPTHVASVQPQPGSSSTFAVGPSAGAYPGTGGISYPPPSAVSSASGGQSAAAGSNAAAGPSYYTVPSGSASPPPASQPGAGEMPVFVPVDAPPGPATPFDSVPELENLGKERFIYGGRSDVDTAATTNATRITGLVGKGKQETVLLLALGLIVVVGLSMAPAFVTMWTSEGPHTWIWLVLLGGGVQMAYVVWMFTLPDWSTVWVGTLLFAFSAAIYGGFFVIIAFTDPAHDVILDLTAVRDRAGGWCASMVLLMTFVSFICGRISTKWRKEFELAKSRKKTNSRQTTAAGMV